MDIEVLNGGSIFLLQPRTEIGRTWLDENLSVEPWQKLGDAVACEHRYVADIVVGMRDDGLQVE